MAVMRAVYKSFRSARAGRSRQGLCALAASAAATLTVATAPAAAESSGASIEGIWAFNGGRVAIVADSAGGYRGVVVAPTRFDQCEHEVGEQMWTAIKEDGDDSFAGQHQWFSGDGTCTPLKKTGKTAWRLMSDGDGVFLRVCFSSPESGLQPLIAGGGEASDASFGCVDSDLISRDVKGATTLYLRLPRLHHCISRPRLRIRINDWPNDPIQELAGSLRSGTTERHARVAAASGGGYFATIDLRGLPTTPFRVQVGVATVLGNQLTAKRRYRRCGPMARSRQLRATNPRR